MFLTPMQSQNFESNISVNYDMYIMYQIFPYYVSTLEFSNSKSLFTYRQKGESPTSKKTSKLLKGGDGGNFMKRVDTTTGRIYTDRENDMLALFGKKTMIVDSFNIIKWKLIQDSVKTIADYRCNLAVGYFRGCVYTVWYAPDIPTSFGPWKLNGCPGLILEATRDDKTLSFYATKISFESHTVVLDDMKIKEQFSYKQKRQEHIDEINKNNEQTVADQPRGSDKVVLSYIQCLECDFIDEIKRFPSISLRKRTVYEVTGDEPEIK
jgi:GLPGLI family protein